MWVTPTSSPKMTRMLGFLPAAGFCCACATPVQVRASAAIKRMSLFFMAMSPLLFESENFLPVVLHADHGPAAGIGFVEPLVEAADARFAVVGPFAAGVVVVNVEAETRALAGGGPLQHLQVAVRIAERRDGPAADEFLDAEGFALLVVDEIHRGQLHDDGLAFAHLELLLARAADDLLGRNAVDLLGEGADELHAAAGDDEGLEAVRAQIGEQLEHRLIGEVGVGPLEPRMPRRAQPLLDDLHVLLSGDTR